MKARSSCWLVAATPAAQHDRHQTHASPCSERRRPEETVVYRVVQAH